VSRLLKDLSGHDSIRFSFDDLGNSQHGDGKHGNKHVYFKTGS